MRTAKLSMQLQPLTYGRCLSRWWFGLVQGVVGAVITTVWVVGFWMPWLWDRSEDVVARFGYSGACWLGSVLDSALCMQTATTWQ